MSNINTDNIDSNFPVQGQDNPSQGFRDNFSEIKTQLLVAKSELEYLANNPVGVVTATNTVTGIVKIGSGISITSSATISVSNPFVLYNYTVSTLNTIISTSTGAIVLVTNAPGGSQPCFFNGTDWLTVGTLTQVS
jgi:hypothetical protein